MPYKILVVEDDKIIARLLESTLQDKGYEVTLAFEGKTGLEEALSEKYNLIILDLKLPEEDGLQLNVDFTCCCYSRQAKFHSSFICRWRSLGHKSSRYSARAKGKQHSLVR